jgi:hypothetical protein
LIELLKRKILGAPDAGKLNEKGSIPINKGKTLQMTYKLGREIYVEGGGKEVLIKSIAQAVPTYVMRVFKLPANLCEELTQMIRYVLWGEEGGHRKIHWIT